MNPVVIEIFKTVAVKNLLMWGANCFVQLLLFFHFNQSDFFPLLDILVFLIGVLGSCIFLNVGGGLDFLRYTAENRLKYWLQRLSLIFAIIGLNLFVLVLKNHESEIVIKILSKLDSTELLSALFLAVWPVICFFLFCVICTMKSSKQNTNFNYKNAKGFGLSLVCSLLVWIFLWQIFKYTFFGGIVFVVFLAWTMISISDPHMQQTLHAKLRLKTWTIGILILAALMVLTTTLISRNFKTHSEFLGAMGPDKLPWKFDDLATVKDAAAWKKWYREIDRELTLDEALKAMNHLSELCTPISSDRLLVITCRGNSKENEIGFFEQNWSANDILSLINSDSYFGKVIGIVHARALARPLNQEITNAISAYLKTPGPLSVLAQTTLDMKNRAKRVRVELKIVDSEPMAKSD